MPTFTPRAAATGLTTEMTPSFHVLRPSPRRADMVAAAAAGMPRSPRSLTPSTAVLFLAMPAETGAHSAAEAAAHPAVHPSLGRSRVGSECRHAERRSGD